jgi:hypothetical protein
MAVAVIASKTEPKCKLCQHPQRTEIDALLEQRSSRATDENGVQVNGDYVLARLGEMGVSNPTRENLSVHWRKHCERVTGSKGDQLEEEQAKALDELIAILDSDEYPETMDGHLQKLWDLGLAEVKRRIMRGDSSGITLDQMRWIAGERTRRQHNESQSDLLAALTGGIAIAEITAVKATVSARPALPSPAPVEDVLDAEDYAVIADEEASNGS